MTYRSGNESNHRDGNLTAKLSIVAAMHGEKILKLICNRGCPTSEVQVTDDCDDPIILIWQRTPDQSSMVLSLFVLDQFTHIL